MSRGGTREGAGRPKGEETTKVAVYKIDKDLINGFAKELKTTVPELIRFVFKDSKFDSYLKSLDTTKLNSKEK